MAARELLAAIDRLGLEHKPLAGIYNQRMEALLLSPEQRQDRQHKKRYVKEAVLRLVDLGGLPKGSPLNEHVYDAIALGLTHLHDLKRSEA